jgi:Mce-associated membrane protein
VNQPAEPGGVPPADPPSRARRAPAPEQPADGATPPQGQVQPGGDWWATSPPDDEAPPAAEDAPEAPAAEEAAGAAWAVQMPSPREEPRPRKRGRRKGGAREQAAAEQAAPAAGPAPPLEEAPPPEAAAERAPAGVAWAVRMPGVGEEPAAEEAHATLEEPAVAEQELVEQVQPAAERAPADGDGWAVRVKAAPQSVRPARRRSAPGPRRRLTRVPLRGLVAAVVVAVLLVGWLALRLRDDRAATVAREEAVAAARLHAPEILSYDYRHLDQDFAKAQADLTGKFKEDYARTTITVVKPVAVDNKAVVEARVVAASTIWARPGEAQVLLFVNQQTTTAKTKGPRVDLNRVRMTLEKTRRGWLVSNVEAL